MALPLRITHAGTKGYIKVQLTREGLGLKGETEPRLDLLVDIWDALCASLALGEIDLSPLLGYREAERRYGEARAALQHRLKGRT